MNRGIDVMQIGARTHRTSRCCEVGRTKTPVLLKRGMASTLEELLMAAEYIMSEGNEQVIRASVASARSRRLRATPLTSTPSRRCITSPISRSRRTLPMRPVAPATWDQWHSQPARRVTHSRSRCTMTRRTPGPTARRPSRATNSTRRWNGSARSARQFQAHAANSRANNTHPPLGKDGIMATSAYTLDIDTAHPYQMHIGTFLLEQVGAITQSVAPQAQRALHHHRLERRPAVPGARRAGAERGRADRGRCDL